MEYDKKCRDSLLSWLSCVRVELGTYTNILGYYFSTHIFLVFSSRKHLALPHPDTIGSWISTVEANPGFMEEVFEAISRFPDDKRDVNIICDAMSIKSRVQWDRKRDKMWGYCDYGQINVPDSEVEASEALVFMVACLNGSWKLPVAYFFQDKCSAELLGELIKTCMQLCDKTGLRIRSYTCDGSPSNWSSLKTLGFDTNFNPDNISHTLKYEYNGVEKVVYFTPDACHASKLARNALGNFFHAKFFCFF